MSRSSNEQGSPETDDSRLTRVGPPPDSPANLRPQRLTLIYAAFGALWILLSDIGLDALVRSNGMLETHGQTLKGWLFILITAVSLYLILMHYANRLSAKMARSDDCCRLRLY